MDFQSFLIPALDRVLAWDLPEEAYGAALAYEAQLMARHHPDLADHAADD